MSIMDQNKHLRMNQDGALIIPNATETDSGMYECRVTQDGIVQESVNLEIIQMKIKKSKHSLLAPKFGDNVTFDCIIEVCLYRLVLYLFHRDSVQFMYH